MHAVKNCDEDKLFSDQSTVKVLKSYYNNYPKKSYAKHYKPLKFLHFSFLSRPLALNKIINRLEATQ